MVKWIVVYAEKLNFSMVENEILNLFKNKYHNNHQYSINRRSEF